MKRSLQVLLFLLLAIWVPWLKGIAFLEPVLLGAYVSLGVIFAAPMVAAGVAALRSVWLGFAISTALTVVGILTVYATRRVTVGPDLVTLAECALFGLALSAAVCSGLALLDHRRVDQRKLAARVVLFGLLGLFYLRAAWLPDVALQGALACAALSVFFSWRGAK